MSFQRRALGPLLLAGGALGLPQSGHAAGVWLVVALVFGLIGDIALLDDTVAWRFITGLAAFLVGHLLYVVCFLALGTTADWRLYAAGLVVAAALSIGRVDEILRGAHAEGGAGLVGPVVVYMLVIAAMTVATWLEVVPLDFLVLDRCRALRSFQGAPDGVWPAAPRTPRQQGLAGILGRVVSSFRPGSSAR